VSHFGAEQRTQLNTHQSDAIKVLVVDDQPIVRGNLRIRFERLGCSVAEAENAFHAREVFDRFRPQFVTLDIVMPELGGVTALDLLRHIRTQELRTEVVVISSVLSPTEREHYLSEGAIAFLVKPFDSFEGLIRKVKPLIRVLQLGNCESPSADARVEEANFTPPYLAGTHTVSCVDQAVLRELRELADGSGDDLRFVELIDTFLTEISGHIDSIRNASNDAGEVSFRAHSIKGAASSVGARRLAALAAELEAEALGGRILDASSTVGRLEEEFRMVSHELVVSKAEISEPTGRIRH
jgi:CheY-like chemotaxis protein/HPt (histidine-containing phosphotransfer) domain-containing protein